jgi:hypothetical protein
VWQILLGYLPPVKERRAPTLARRRREYTEYCDQYYNTTDDRLEHEHAIAHQIAVDVPRTSPGVKFFQHANVQNSLNRMMYIWAVKHPASGYVQGMNDLATPLYLVFLSRLTSVPVMEIEANDVSPEHFMSAEADTFWCLSKLLHDIQDHYTFAQPGIQTMVFKLKELISRIDQPLHDHIEKQGVEFIHFSFRWMNCLLMREMSLELIIRIWDTYMSEEQGFKVYHLYVCAAFLMYWAQDLRSKEFQDLVMFLQKLPTQNWGAEQVEQLMAQAYIYKTQYHDAPAHLQ